MKRSEVAQRLIQQGISPQAADYAVSLIQTEDVSDDQVNRLAASLKGVDVGDTGFREAVASAVPIGPRDTKAKKGDKGDTATEEATNADVFAGGKVEALVSALSTNPQVAGLGKTSEEIRKLAVEALEKTGGDTGLAGAEVQKQLNLEQTAIEAFSKMARRPVTSQQIQAAIQLYNSKARSAEDRIDGIGTALLYAEDAKFQSALGVATQAPVVRRNVTMYDRFGQERNIESGMFDSYLTTLGIDPLDEAGIGSVLADALAEENRKASAGLKRTAQAGWEALVPFIKDTYNRTKVGSHITSGAIDLEAAGPLTPDEILALDRKLEAQAQVDQYRARLAAFGEQHPLAALISTIDEELATKMLTVGINDQEYRQVLVYMKGVDPEKLGLIGDSIDFYTEKFKKAQAGGSGREIVLPDRNKIAEGFRELYRSWFKMDPTEAELEGLISETTAQFVAAQQGNTSPDLAADMVARTRQTDLYQRLFANKAQGASEEEYVGQFEGAARQLLGGEIANASAIQAGMESGQMSTTVGAVAGSKQAFENSTFRERLAHAAQLVSRLT